MANTLFDKGRESFLGQNPAIDWDTDTIKCSLLRGYTIDQTDQYLADITTGGATIVSTTAALGTKTVTAGVADAADTVFSAVPAGAACAHVIIFKDTGVAGTSPLIGVIDTATGLPITPGGSDINLAFDNGANKIFKL